VKGNKNKVKGAERWEPEHAGWNRVNEGRRDAQSMRGVKKKKKGELKLKKSNGRRTGDVFNYQ